MLTCIAMGGDSWCVLAVDVVLARWRTVLGFCGFAVYFVCWGMGWGGLSAVGTSWWVGFAIFWVFVLMHCGLPSRCLGDICGFEDLEG